jgi:hypothetical protein
MDRFAVSATLEARRGKEGEVEEFLKSAQILVMQEAGTMTWFAFRIGPATFGIFDTFANEAGLQAHLSESYMCNAKTTPVSAVAKSTGF